MSIACVPHFIVDNFLPDEVHKGLLAHTLNVDDFAPGKVITNGEAAYNFDSRKGKLSNDRLGPFLPAFIKALRSVFPDICAATGVAEFALVDLGGKVFVGRGDRDQMQHDRLITAVYYFHQLPRKFEGGELCIHPFDRSAPAVIEPRNNRLVAFPSFILHEVLPVAVPSGAFADSRFSVSCWFDRQRPGE